MNGTQSVAEAKDPEESVKVDSPNKKSKLVAYFLWLIGGIFGAHHIYLERDKQAFVWTCTLGGYCGFGCLRDLFRIPSYVAEYNADPRWVDDFKRRVRDNAKVSIFIIFFMIFNQKSHIFYF